MSTSAVIMMIVMLTLFWGGFAGLLIRALGRRSEGGGDGDPQSGR